MLYFLIRAKFEVWRKQNRGGLLALDSEVRVEREELVWWWWGMGMQNRAVNGKLGFFWW